MCTLMSQIFARTNFREILFFAWIKYFSEAIEFEYFVGIYFR